MRKSKFERDTFSLAVGFIVPPFVMVDSNLVLDEKYQLSQFLHQHMFLGEFKITVVKCDCCNNYEINCQNINKLQDLYYISVTSTEEFDNCTKFGIQIHPWYQRYIKMNPYYGVYQVNYFHFLKSVILPEITDVHLKEELINTILDNSTDNNVD